MATTKSMDDVIIGLEIHVQVTPLKTKLFCGCDADYRDSPPNTHLCPVCLGLPGSLPVLNEKAVTHGIMTGLALNCEIPEVCTFYRKNYYYPDMPKNFQISQYDKAGGVTIASSGYLNIKLKNEDRRVGITRIQIEEDPGKLSYPGTIDKSAYTLIDYNRAGICLLEIVTDPDLHSPEEARLFLQKLRAILEHLGIEVTKEGAMRCDANISLRGGTRVEIKNISGFKEVQRALQFEIKRQKQMKKMKRTETKMQTRHWDDERRMTILLRTKEEEHDYRYFPEPDLVRVRVSPEMLEEIKQTMPELPEERMQRFMKDHGLSEYDAGVLTSSKAMADFFENAVKLGSTPKTICNWMINDVLKHLNQENIEINESKITPKLIISLLDLIEKGTISGKIAKKILVTMIDTGKQPEKIVKESGLLRISDRSEIVKFVEKVFQEHPGPVQDALTNEKTIRFLVGQVMKMTKGKADPTITNNIIKEKLDEIRNSKDI
ncbi:MAG: Asp-tRNA(Asn)/Glu-tRNA(Gln) amidotransferase subunit GatB [Candidatus Helarchaeota archaeon]